MSIKEIADLVLNAKSMMEIKSKDIGGLGVELEQRKGSGNYDKDRTQFNKEYVGLDGYPTLSSKVYQTIYTNNIHFNKEYISASGGTLTALKAGNINVWGYIGSSPKLFTITIKKR